MFIVDSERCPADCFTMIGVQPSSQTDNLHVLFCFHVQSNAFATPFQAPMIGEHTHREEPQPHTKQAIMAKSKMTRKKGIHFPSLLSRRSFCMAQRKCCDRRLEGGQRMTYSAFSNEKVLLSMSNGLSTRTLRMDHARSTDQGIENRFSSETIVLSCQYEAP